MMAVDEPLQVVARVRPAHCEQARAVDGYRTSTVSANELECDLRNHGGSETN
jgi:hypothetical protein